MTLLMYHLKRHTITVVTDTLASSAGGPDLTATKYRVPEHGRFIIAGTGLEDVIAPWLDMVAASGLKTVDEVVQFSERLLPERWTAVMDGIDDDPGHTTAFVFGFRNGKSTRVQLSSRDGFLPDRKRPPRIAIRPPPPMSVLETLTPYEDGTDDDLLAIARAVAAHTREHPDDVRIGGDAIAAQITSRGRRTIKKLGTLD
ncbi:hypothetical protein [Rhodococcus sp. UFZ-B548]|uniref:hypothetical protein n=1 Tax=Rhodococcus sp. UFZ-B548 TaxID=2742212 RepID=UPI0015F635B0|nr:hypothetical protein [Rhodococcus sp. UFZ-B548]